MLFLHIVDDYYLQGRLIDMKQKQWWAKQIPHFKSSKYNNDYIVALLCHSFSWSFMVHLPLMLYNYSDAILVSVIINTIIHCIVDDLKANKLCINLCTDQFIHFLQITITAFLFLFNIIS